MADEKQPAAKGPEDDAKAQFEKTKHGGNNDGAVSANPRVLSEQKDGDATFPIKKHQ
jgi:hypothetical protein